MDKQEFLLLIPGIVYGVAIVDLLKIVQHKINYWEIVLWGVLLLTTIINHWMELYKKLDAIVDSTINFYLIIGQAMVYAQAANVITLMKLERIPKHISSALENPFSLSSPFQLP